MPGSRPARISNKPLIAPPSRSTGCHRAGAGNQHAQTEHVTKATYLVRAARCIDLKRPVLAEITNCVDDQPDHQITPVGTGSCMKSDQGDRSIKPQPFVQGPARLRAGNSNTEHGGAIHMPTNCSREHGDRDLCSASSSVPIQTVAKTSIRRTHCATTATAMSLSTTTTSTTATMTTTTTSMSSDVKGGVCAVPLNPTMERKDLHVAPSQSNWQPSNVHPGPVLMYSSGHHLDSGFPLNLRKEHSDTCPPVSSHTQESIACVPSSHEYYVGMDKQGVGEYVGEIKKYLRDIEMDHQPVADYMRDQPEINAEMRGVLVDWLVDVHKKYRFRMQTLFLAVSLIDRYLSAMTITRSKLQLLGVAAMFIASKYEETRVSDSQSIDKKKPPKASAFAHLTAKDHTKEDVLEMEAVILNVLDFEICTPTLATFIDQLQRVNACENDEHRYLIQYILELSLLDVQFLQLPLLCRVAAAVYLSNILLACTSWWSGDMVAATGLDVKELFPVAVKFWRVMTEAESNALQAVRKKFSRAQFNNVANISLPFNWPTGVCV